MKYTHIIKLSSNSTSPKYFFSASEAAFSMEANETQQFTMKTIPALIKSNLNQAYELEACKDVHIDNGVEELSKDAVHQVYFNTEDNSSGSGMSASANSYSISLNPKKGPYHHTEEATVYQSTTGQFYWVKETNKVKLEPAEKEFVAITPKFNHALDQAKDRIRNQNRQLFSVFNQKTAELAQKKIELQQMQDEIASLEKQVTVARINKR